MNRPEALIRQLIQINGIIISDQEPFTWSSGMQSPIYCDNRLILSYPKLRDNLKRELIPPAKKMGPLDGIAAVATAGIPMGTLLADVLDLPFSYVRSEAKGHGKENRVEGRTQTGDRILVFEDLISTGGSAIRAVEALREKEIEVVGVLSIFSYGFDATSRAFEEADCSYSSLFQFEDLYRIARKHDAFDPALIDVLENWRNDPEHWSPPSQSS